MSLDTLSKLEDALGISLIYDEQVAYPCMVAEEEVFAQGAEVPDPTVPVTLLRPYLYG